MKYFLYYLDNISLMGKSKNAIVEPFRNLLAEQNLADLKSTHKWSADTFSNSKSSLADLFKPPTDINYIGTLGLIFVLF